MELTQFPIRVLRRKRRDHRAEQDLIKAAGRREDHSSHHQAHVNAVRCKEGPDPVNEKSHRRKNRYGFDGFGNVELMRKKAEDQIHRQLCSKVNKNQQAQR